MCTRCTAGPKLKWDLSIDVLNTKINKMVTNVATGQFEYSSALHPLSTATPYIPWAVPA